MIYFSLSLLRPAATSLWLSYLRGAVRVWPSWPGCSLAWSARGGAGHGSHPVGAGNPGKLRSSVMEPIHGWTLDSNAREAKERLDQKLRNQRETVIKTHHRTGSITLNRGGGGGGGGGGEGSTVALGMQREVYSKKGVMRRLMRWSRLRWVAAEQAECAVCLEEFGAGDVLAHLPCGHRFHWACALPWLEGSSRSCPFCRAAVDAGPRTPAPPSSAPPTVSAPGTPSTPSRPGQRQGRRMRSGEGACAEGGVESERPLAASSARWELESGGSGGRRGELEERAAPWRCRRTAPPSSPAPDLEKEEGGRSKKMSKIVT